MYRTQKKILTAILVVAAVVAIYAAYARQEGKSRIAEEAAAPSGMAVPASAFTHPITIGTTVIQAATAITEAQREQGLSDTTSLGADQGMLFVFDHSQTPMFWMKDMHYALDMIWVQDGKVADITADAEPKDFPKTYSPKIPVTYVIEVNSGFAAAHGIAVGDAVTL